MIVAASPWMSRAWRRAAWLTLLAGGRGADRHRHGPADGTGPRAGHRGDRGRRGPGGVRRARPADGAGEIAEALRGAGVPAASVRPAEVETKGSRPFAAVAADGRRLFIKALGSDQRDADLLYRAYRAVRLRNVGDTRPAASLFQAVEHQALVGVMAERAGVDVPGVDRVVSAGGDTALLVMEWVDGSSLEQLPAGQISDDLLVRLWAEVDKLHRAGIAHRSLRAANVMVDQRRPAQDRRLQLLRAGRHPAADGPGPGRTARVAGHPGRRGPGRVQPRPRSSAPREWRRRCRCCSRWPCPPPPGAPLSAQDGLLARTRAAAAAASGQKPPELARVQRVQPRTLLAIAAAGRRVLHPAARAGEGRQAAGQPCSRPTGHGCPWSSPSRR